MHDKRTCDAAEQDDYDDWGVMLPLLNDDDQRPWSVAELVLEVGDEVKTIDALGRLRRRGLIHRTSDGLVYPTRAALHMDRIKS